MESQVGNMNYHQSAVWTFVPVFLALITLHIWISHFNTTKNLSIPFVFKLLIQSFMNLKIESHLNTKIVCISSQIKIHIVYLALHCKYTWQFLSKGRFQNWMLSWFCSHKAMMFPKSIYNRSMKASKSGWNRSGTENPTFGPWFACWLLESRKCSVCSLSLSRICCCLGSSALRLIMIGLINFYKSGFDYFLFLV